MNVSSVSSASNRYSAAAPSLPASGTSSASPDFASLLLQKNGIARTQPGAAASQLSTPAAAASHGHHGHSHGHHKGVTSAGSASLFKS